MRIAFISYEYPPDSANGGIATYVGQVTRILAERGHEVEVFASSPVRDEMVVNQGICEHWINETNREAFGIVAGHRFANRHAVHPFEVLEGPEYNADARKAVELVPEIPLVVRMHTPSQMIVGMNCPGIYRMNLRKSSRSLLNLLSDIAKHRPLRPLHISPGENIFELDCLEREHARQAQYVAPPCQSLGEHALKEWNIPEERIRVTPYPYSPGAELLALQPKESGQIVGFVGRMERRKGIETLTRAIPIILDAVPGARFHFIGTQGGRAGSRELYGDWLLRTLKPHRDSISMLGKIPLAEMHKAYDDLNICVYPSLWENFPNVCLEAMAAARAVIGSAAGGMAEMLDQGSFGRLVEPHDHRNLAKQIIDLLRNPAERVRLGSLARQRVLDAYNKDRIGGLMEVLYRDAIRAKRDSLHA